MDDLKSIIGKVATGATLSRDEAASAFDAMMSGEATPSQMGGLLMALTLDSQKLAGNEQIAQEVGKNPNGVGYVGLAYTKASGIKVVPIDGASPSKESVLAKRYPYARPTFFYTNGEPTGVVKEFIDFTVGPEGQKIVEQVGFVPIK